MVGARTHVDRRRRCRPAACVASHPGTDAELSRPVPWWHGTDGARGRYAEWAMGADRRWAHGVPRATAPREAPTPGLAICPSGSPRLAGLTAPCCFAGLRTRLNPKNTQTSEAPRPPPSQSRHAQYPALDLRHRAVGWREVRLQQARERAVAVDPPEPGRYAEGVMLIRRAPFEREAAAPQRRIDFSEFTIGYEGRFDYAAIGTVSNVASRLCDEAKPGQILISPRVLMKVESAVKVEPVGEFELKGIRRPLVAYNVVAIIN